MDGWLVVFLGHHEDRVHLVQMRVVAAANISCLVCLSYSRIKMETRVARLFINMRTSNSSHSSQ